MYKVYRRVHRCREMPTTLKFISAWAFTEKNCKHILKFIKRSLWQKLRDVLVDSEVMTVKEADEILYGKNSSKKGVVTSTAPNTAADSSASSTSVKASKLGINKKTGIIYLNY